MKLLLADASAILAYLDFEPGGEIVAEHLADIALTTVNLAEVVTVLTLRDIKKEWIETRVLRVFGNVLPFDREQAQLTGTLAILTQKYGLSLGDRACLAAGIIMDAKVLTADQAWRKLNLGIEIVFIRVAPIMAGELIPSPSPKHSAQIVLDKVPALFRDTGDRAAFRFVEFFTANISNKNTRTAYAVAVRRFADWCQSRGFRLDQLTPIHVAAYIEELGRALAKPSVKQHLAAIRMLFDYLVTGQIVPHNPAASVRGPKYVVKKGKTPVLTLDEARALFAALEPKKKQPAGEEAQETEPEWTPAALRDRALIGIMVYSFARIGAVLGINVEDYYQQGKRWWIRLTEKGGKHHEIPAHHKAEEFLDAYLAAAGIGSQAGTPLFRSINARRQLTGNRFVARDALAMVKRQAKASDLGDRISCHTFRATGITVYLQNGGTVEKAQQIAAHESPRTTKLYDRTHDEVSLDEIERIQI